MDKARMMASDISNQCTYKIDAIEFVEMMERTHQVSKELAKAIKKSLRTDFDWGYGG